MAGLMREFGTLSKAGGGRRLFILGVAAATVGGMACAAAQAPEPSPNPTPDLKLSAAQRQLIYASLSKRTHTSTAAPPNFLATLGATLPEAIELVRLPETVVEVVPQLRGHAYAFVGGQVLIVEPQPRRIVEIIAESASGEQRGGDA